jgi:hypothetical protein
MFVMRNRADRDTKLAVAQVEALVSLIQDIVSNLQSVKHGEAPSIVIGCSSFGGTSDLAFYPIPVDQ